MECIQCKKCCNVQLPNCMYQYSNVKYSITSKSPIYKKNTTKVKVRAVSVSKM